MISGALSLFLVLSSHQYVNTHDIDPLISKSPTQHAAKYMDVGDDEEIPVSKAICPDDRSKKAFDRGLSRVIAIAEFKANRGASPEEVSDFVDEQIKHGMEMLHCHL